MKLFVGEWSEPGHGTRAGAYLAGEWVEDAQRIGRDGEGARSEASYWQQHPGIVKKYLAPYAEKKPQQVIGWVQRHGVEYRNPHNLTPLMLAALAGNSGLVETLIERGADPAAVDNVGRTAFHLALRKAGVDERYARGSFPTLWRQLAPAAVFLSVDDRLVQLDASQIEYLLFNVVFMRLREQMCPPFGTHRRPGLSAQQILDCMNNIPAHLFGESRRKRSYLSGVLARNEVARDYAYNRLLFLRVQHGLYALNPRLRVRMGETWMPVYDLMDVSDEGFPGFEQRAFAGSLVDAAGRYLDDLTATTRAASEERDAAVSSR